jgi:predicted aldo/keto reductase-like oxidoreductase
MQHLSMSPPIPNIHRQRTCRACGKKFDYPVKGGAATRHHCADCVAVPPETRKILERLNQRVTQLERQLESQSRRQAANPVPPTL